MPYLLIALLVVPFLELYLIIEVGQEIGVGPTIALLVLDSALGAWLVRREGRRAWKALAGSFGAGKMPTRELVDGALVLVGGTLLLTPGFATDALGFFLILPFTRPLARRALIGFASRRFTAMVVGGPPGPATTTRPPGPTDTSTPGGEWPRGGRVVSGEVVDDDRDRDA